MWPTDLSRCIHPPSNTNAVHAGHGHKSRLLRLEALYGGVHSLMIFAVMSENETVLWLAYLPRNQNIESMAMSMTPVPAQPNILIFMEMANGPMTSRLEASSMMTTMMGTEITPLMTALQ